MMVLRTLDGAPKWALRDFLLEEATTAIYGQFQLFLGRAARALLGKKLTYYWSLQDVLPSL